MHLLIKTGSRNLYFAEIHPYRTGTPLFGPRDEAMAFLDVVEAHRWVRILSETYGVETEVL